MTENVETSLLRTLEMQRDSYAKMAEQLGRVSTGSLEAKADQFLLALHHVTKLYANVVLPSNDFEELWPHHVKVTAVKNIEDYHIQVVLEQSPTSYYFEVSGFTLTKQPFHVLHLIIRFLARTKRLKVCDNVTYRSLNMDNDLS